jgi:hypothetical protein
MRSLARSVLVAALVAPVVLSTPFCASTGHADEPGRFRLFRFGGAPAPVPAPASPASAAPALESAGVNAAPSGATTSGSAAPRIVPQPRNSRSATESDPIVTRAALGRSVDGRTFGMFLQVFADGTVIDSEGVHRVGREGIKPVLDALRSDELYRIKGHCGGPPTDFLEDIHYVVFERSYGRLRANAFSFSGNPQGCDPSVRKLHAALELLQTRIGQATPTGPVSSPAAPTSHAAPAERSHVPAPAPPPPLAAPIRLEPAEGEVR